MGVCCMTQGTQSGAMWQSRRVGGKGGKEGRGHWCTNGWFLSIYDRTPKNSVKQVSFNLKNKVAKKKKKKKRKWTENKAIGMGNGLVEDTMQNELKWSQEWQSQFDRGNANRILAEGSEGVGVDNSPRL